VKRIRCYIYREGQDFTLPERFTAMSLVRPETAECVVDLPDGSHGLHPEHFDQVSPEEAEIFLFPYDLGYILNYLSTAETVDFLRTLPYLKGREARHVFSDNGDSPACILLPTLLFKRSLLKFATGEHSRATSLQCLKERPDAPFPVTTWYSLSKHVAEDKPSFNLQSIRYDCSFVGGYNNNIIRKVAAKSLERQENIRFYSGGFDNMRVEENCFLHHPQTPEEMRKRQETFRRVTKASLTVLCPPGIGPQSIRMYEVMYYGRIPILFTRKICYPFEDRIDYESFCLFIEEEDIPRTGSIVRRWLDEQGNRALWNKCVLACKTWNTWFNERSRVTRMADCVRNHMSRYFLVKL
jgi:hypothetical protein